MAIALYTSPSLFFPFLFSPDFTSSLSQLFSPILYCICMRAQKNCKKPVPIQLHAINGIWIIHVGSRKITVCSSTFYGVNSNSWYRHSKNYIYIKITGTNSKNYSHAEFRCASHGSTVTNPSTDPARSFLT